MTSLRPFLLLRISFPWRPIFIQLPPGFNLLLWTRCGWPKWTRGGGDGHERQLGRRGHIGVFGWLDSALKCQRKKHKMDNRTQSLLKSVPDSVAICCPSKRASLEKFGHYISATATTGLDMYRAGRPIGREVLKVRIWGVPPAGGPLL